LKSSSKKTKPEKIKNVKTQSNPAVTSKDKTGSSLDKQLLKLTDKQQKKLLVSIDSEKMWYEMVSVDWRLL